MANFFFLPFWRGASCPWGYFTIVVVVFLKSLVLCQFCPEFIPTASHDMRSHGWAVLLLQLWQHVDMEKSELVLCRLINFTCSWRSVYSFLLGVLSHLPWISILKVRETALWVSFSLENKTWKKIGAQHMFFHRMAMKGSFYSFGVICSSCDAAKDFSSVQSPVVLLYSPWLKQSHYSLPALAYDKLIKLWICRSLKMRCDRLFVLKEVLQMSDKSFHGLRIGLKNAQLNAFILLLALYQINL